MRKSRSEWKVGLFVLIGLVLLAALLLQFSKGMSIFQPAYNLILRAPNLGGGLKTGAAVLMSGVQVGTVSHIELAPDGKSVSITLRLSRNYVVHKDARFVIEQSGFLGDQYVAIIPTENKGEIFENGGEAQAEAPFNIQEFTRSANGFLGRLDQTVKNLNETLAEVSRVVLNPETLTNVSETAANLRLMSDHAVATVDSLSGLIESNAPQLELSISNLAVFSGQLNQFAAEFRRLLATNSDPIAEAVKNVQSSSESLKSVMADLEAGKGLAGNLLRNEQLAAEVSQIANNLTMTTSNLNRLGLWGILWQHKPPRTSAPPPRPLPSPKGAEQHR